MTKHCPRRDCPGFLRDGVAPEFRDELDACIDCGGTLMSGAVREDPSEPPRFSDLRTVFIASDAVQAHLVRGLIEAEGMHVYLKGEALGSAIGELPANVGQIEVQVDEEDRPRAREIALRFEGSGWRTGELPEFDEDA